MPDIINIYQRVVPLSGLGIFERNFITGDFYWNSIIRVILEVDDNFSSGFEESVNFYKDPKKLYQLMNRSIASNQPETDQLELVTAAGNLKWVKVWIQADNEGGRCVRIYGTLQDITKEIKLLNLLEEREKRFTNAFDHAPIGMALVSLRGGWIKVNQSLCKLLGWEERDLLKHSFQDFTHPEDLDKDLKQLEDLLKGNSDSYSMEKRYFHKDGRIIWALLNVSLVLDEAGNPLYFISQIKDITERKKSTEIIGAQNGRLLNFAHIVSHNLRSHTGNIQMLTNMILAEKNRDEQMKLVEMLAVNADNLQETLSNLNEVVKVHDNGLIGKVPLILSKEVGRVLNFLTALIIQSDAKVLVEIADNIQIEFNAAYIESILINLIGNALKYRHPGRSPIITIAANKIDGRVRLNVNDNGLGIDLTLHGHKLFGMYKTFHRHPDARGMGLFIVKSQVEAMGGQIWAESQVNIGTTFTIEFD